MGYVTDCFECGKLYEAADMQEATDMFRLCPSCLGKAKPADWQAFNYELESSLNKVKSLLFGGVMAGYVDRKVAAMLAAAFDVLTKEK